MISLFINPVNSDGLQNAQVRKKWDIKKYLTRFQFAVFTTSLILIGLALASPSYSISTIIVEHAINQSDDLKAIIEHDFLKTVFIDEFDKEKGLPIYSGSSLKFAIFFIIFWVVSVHFLSNDPLSNSELLRNLVKKTKNSPLPFLFRWMSELSYYAKHSPSNRLPEKCNECATFGCGNRLGHGEDRKTFHWNSIFAKLSPVVVNNISYSTFKCRYIFFVRYSAWMAAAALTLAYVLVRLFELTVLGDVNLNKGLIIYIGLLWFFGFVIGQFNSVGNENARGVWGQFSESINELFHMEEFMAAFVNSVCKYDRKTYEFSKSTSSRKAITSGCEIQRLITLVSFLDDVVKQKVIRAWGKRQAAGDKDSLRAILTALIEMLSVINQKEINFRCALFVVDENQQHLIPLVSIPFNNQPFVTFEQKAVLVNKLALDSDCVASLAWQTRQPRSAALEGITYFREEQQNYLRSMIAIPLVIDPDMQKQAANSGVELGVVIGVVTVDCDQGDYFTPESQSRNLIEIYPFVNRAIFEMTYSSMTRSECHA